MVGPNSTEKEMVIGPAPLLHCGLSPQHNDPPFGSQPAHSLEPLCRRLQFPVRFHILPMYPCIEADSGVIDTGQVVRDYLPKYPCRQAYTV